MDSYRCNKVIPRDTLAVTISDTVEYRHDHLTIPTVTSIDKILHGLHSRTGALIDAPTGRVDSQLKAVGDVCDAFHCWLASGDTTSQPITPVVPAPPVRTKSTCCSPRLQTPVQLVVLSRPETQPAPRVDTLPPKVPITVPPPTQPAPRVVVWTPQSDMSL